MAELQEEVAKLKSNDIVHDEKLKKVSPIGTILPWIPKVNKTSGDLLPIPEGWQYCNGSLITAGPWAGGNTPNLNGLFLRGGDVDNVLEMEESQLQDHEHEDSGHSHSCSASSTSSQHRHSFKKGNDVSDGGCDGCNTYWVADASSDHSKGGDHTEYTSYTTVSVSTSCSLGSRSANIGGVDSSGANAGSETRPANMKVHYIIRVF